jgi:hypothetical protein
MDKQETNNLPEKTGLDDTLTDAVNQTAEQMDTVASTVEPETQPTEPEVAPAAKPKRAPRAKKTVVNPEATDAIDTPAPEAEPVAEAEPIAEAEPVVTVPLSKQDVIDQLKALIEQPGNDKKDRIDYLKQAFYRLHKVEHPDDAREEGEEPEAVAPETEGAKAAENDPLEEEFKALLNSWREKRAEHNAEQEKQRAQNLEKKKTIIEDIRLLTESTEDIGRTLPEFRRLQQTWKETGPVPQDQVNELWKNYQVQVERFYDLLKINNEFREYDFKKNLEIKTTLCESAEKLAEEPDVVVAFRQLQKLHEEWRETGPVAREYREDIWNRFKNASTQINRIHQQFFERLKLTENENLAKKTAICEQVEAIDYTKLLSYKDWDTMTATVIQLQEQWKSIGFAPKKVNNKIFERFRAACDTFFRHKSDFYKAAKEVLNQNLEKKKALCEKAEALKDSTDWKATADALIRIQKEWKTIGSVPKKMSDTIWKRFIAACDYFFEQKEKNAPAQKSEEAKNLEAKRALIDEVKQLPSDLSEEEAQNAYKDMTARWNAIGHVPFKEKDAIYKDWHEAIDAIYHRFNSRDTRRTKYQHNADDNSGKGQGKVLHERERLLRQFDSLSTEIKTAENNIGFFTMSKSSGDGLLKEITQKIEALKEERDQIYKKIKQIDEQL